MYNITKSKTFHLLENSVLEDCAYITNIALISSQFLFIYFFCLVYINWMIVWTPIKSLILIVMKNPEMLKLVPDHLKTKQMCNYAVKKLPNLLRSVCDQ